MVEERPIPIQIMVSASMATARYFPNGLLVCAGLLAVGAAGMVAAEYSPNDDKEAKLSAEDAKFLEMMLKGLVFDPKGTEWVKASTFVTPRHATKKYQVDQFGWHDAKQKQVFLSHGASIPVGSAATIARVDFVAACRTWLAKDLKARLEEGSTPGFVPKTAVDAVSQHHDLVLAAWLYRLREDALAAKALAWVGDRSEAVEAVRKVMAKAVFRDMVRAYQEGADDEAVKQGKRLFARFPAEAGGHPFAKAIVADLDRRKAIGTFGKITVNTVNGLPKGFKQWDESTRLEHLVASMDDAETYYFDGTDTVPSENQAALIALGERAISRLIDVVEKDNRLTRVANYMWNSEAGESYLYSIISVRDAALASIESILKTRHFNPTESRTYLKLETAEDAARSAGVLRDYWKKHGALPFDQRMMAILTNRDNSIAAWHEACENLAQLGDIIEPHYCSPVGSIRVRPRKPSAVLTKFKNPTVAEAMLAALDRELAEVLREKGKDEYYLRFPEEFYLATLVELGDQRIAGALSQRSKTGKSIRQKRVYAEAAHWLGDRKPMQLFAEACRTANIKLPQDDARDRSHPAGHGELADMIASLVSVGSAEADKALDAIADPKHPWCELATAAILDSDASEHWHGPWLAHPYCLRILRKALDDNAGTGTAYTISNGRLTVHSGATTSTSPIPAELNRLDLQEKARERRCDVAAERLNTIVAGLPLHHVLLAKADTNLAAMRQTFDRSKLRRAQHEEAEWIEPGWSAGLLLLVPDFPPLGRPATAADVKSGRAIFDLNDQRKLVDKKLPLAGRLKAKRKGEEGEPVIIVQAEADAGGQITYGVIARHAIRTIPASEFESVGSFDKK